MPLISPLMPVPQQCVLNTGYICVFELYVFQMCLKYWTVCTPRITVRERIVLGKCND